MYLPNREKNRSETYRKDWTTYKEYAMESFFFFFQIAKENLITQQKQNLLYKVANVHRMLSGTDGVWGWSGQTSQEN